MIRISMKSLKADMKLGKAIYTEEGKLLLGRGVIINNFFVKNLAKRGISSIFIHDGATEDVDPTENISEMVRGTTISHLRALFDSLEEIRNEKTIVPGCQFGGYPQAVYRNIRQ